MKIRNKMILSLIIILTASIPVFYIAQNTSFELQPETDSIHDREDLKEVVYSNTDCAKYWREELFDMWDDVDHNYKNDPVFIECSEALTSQKHLANLEFDKWGGDGDIHYDRVNSDKKYWATLKDIKLDNDDESIKVEFSGNGFETRWMTTDKQEKTYSVQDFRYVTTIHKGQEFVIYEVTWNSILQTPIRHNDGIIMIFLNLILPMMLIVLSTLVSAKLWSRHITI